jgi:broad specificity phosphatase PhoE
MELYLIRHGESANNRGDLPRVADPPLTDLGIEQARRAGEALKDKGITQLYCSPMLRALHTAKIIGEILELAPHVFVGLHEWGGVWEEREDGTTVELTGLTRAQMQEVCPNVVLPEDVTDEGWWFHEWQGDEAMLELAHNNAQRFLAYLKENYVHTAERLAVVWHGGSGSTHISAFLNIPSPEGYTQFGQNNTGISRMTMTSTRTILRYLNRVDHLTPDMVT